MNARHLSQSGERYTPSYVVEAARRVVKRFALDPASSEAANTIIQARRIYTAEDDGLSKKWKGPVFINPPGTCKETIDEIDYFPGCGDYTNTGKERKSCVCNYAQRFWEKLLEEVDAGNVPVAIWIGFNCSQLQSLQQCVLSPSDFLTCMVDHRIKYLDTDLEELASPPHNSYVTLVCAPGAPEEKLFIEAFSPLGCITAPVERLQL